VVSAPQVVQRQRLLARPGMSAAKLEAILARQMPDAEKRRRAHFVVDTTGSLAATEAAIESLMRPLAGLAAGR
jgi:dephospho-CoA kinase